MAMPWRISVGNGGWIFVLFPWASLFSLGDRQKNKWQICHLPNRPLYSSGNLLAVAAEGAFLNGPCRTVEFIARPILAAICHRRSIRPSVMVAGIGLRNDRDIPVLFAGNRTVQCGNRQALDLLSTADV